VVAEWQSQWANLAFAIVAAPAEQRSAATFHAVTQTLHNAKAYQPAGFAGVAEWTRDEDDFLQALRAQYSAANGDGRFDLRAAANARPYAFGKWRAAVTDHEAIEASKLQTLLWAVRALYDITPAHDNPEVCARLGKGLYEQLITTWKCDVVPMEGDYRAWAIRQTRRYDLLPKAWRFV
jgi:hypothetical protein